MCLGRGAIVLPVFHELTWVSLETIKLIVSRSRDQAILTADKIRIDVVTELYAHVGHTVEDLLTASRSLGEKTFDSEKGARVAGSEGGQLSAQLCRHQGP